MKKVLSASAAMAFAAAAYAQPANDDCANATVVTNGSNTPFDTTTATTDGTATCGFGTGFDVWYSFTAGNTGFLTVSCCDGSFDTVVSIIDGGCGGASLACNDDYCGSGLQSTVFANVAAGQTVLIRVSGYNGQSGTGSLTVDLGGPPPPADDLPATANVPQGTGSLDSVSGSLGQGDSADMFKFTICDFTNFSATTAGNTTQDTQLFLFDADGNAVEMNDDSPAGGGLQSTIRNEFVTANGTYFIAISHYDNDPNNASGAAIWADTPFNVVRAPDGANGGDIQPASWDAGNVTSFDYVITLTGSCYFEDTCAADFNGDAVVDFFDYLDFVQAFAANETSADFNHDQVIDFFDYLDFVQAFAAGC